MLILLSINIKITNIETKNTKKKKKICVLKNCNKNNNLNLNYRQNSVGQAVQNKINNSSCNRSTPIQPRQPINNVYKTES